MKNIAVSFLLLCCYSFLPAQPLDDIVERKLMKGRKVLAYPKVREADVFWEKRVWRVIDVKEKMNKIFVYPENPFFSILSEGALAGEIQLYDVETESFDIPLSKEDLNGILYRIDSFEVYNPETYLPELQIVKDDLNYEDIKRFRIKEVWFFDEERSMMNVRIIGIAPIIEVKDEHGNFRYERPLFWVHYPSLRNYLAQQEVFNPGNDNRVMSWEDVLEMRFFSSTIYKTSNIHDRKLSMYLEGLDLLQEAEKQKQEIFNFEHDLWSY